MSQNVVITGSNRGIGLCLSQIFAKNGYNVYGLCRKSSPELEKVAYKVIDGIDMSSATLEMDIASKLSGVEVDILVNNAGILRRDSLEDLQCDAIREQLEVNSIAPLRVTSALLKSLKKGSKVAIITSRMGSLADNTSGGRYGYRMSKAAVNAAGKSLSVDLHPHGIPVGIYHPGYVQTDMTGNTGNISPEESAHQIFTLLGDLDLSKSGVFYHANGEVLPW